MEAGANLAEGTEADDVDSSDPVDEVLHFDELSHVLWHLQTHLRYVLVLLADAAWRSEGLKSWYKLLPSVPLVLINDRKLLRLLSLLYLV